MKKTVPQTVLIVGIFATSYATALTIDDSSSALNDRFANDPSFIMSGYDLSGIGLTNGGRFGTLVSRNVFITSEHFRPIDSAKLRFYKTNDPNGEMIAVDVGSGQQIGNSDIWISTLEKPVPVGYAVYDFATADITNTSQFNNSVYHDANAFLVGQSQFNNFDQDKDIAVGRNELDRWLDNVSPEGTSATDDALLSSIESEAQDVQYETRLVPGDSGAPMFVDLNNDGSTLQLVGTNWFIGTLTPGDIDINGFAYLGNYDQQIQAFIDSNPVPLLGDLNGNDLLDSLDIDAFVLALTDPASYEQTYATLDPDVRGDFDGNGVLDNLDIFGFVETMTLNGVLTAEEAALFEQFDLSSVPEPSTLALVGLGGLLVLRRRHS